MTHINMNGTEAGFSEVFDLDIVLALTKSNDEIGVVLRIHFILESFIELWCNKITKNEDFFEFRPRPNFSLKLEIAKKLGLNAEVVRFIKTFNKIRNGIAHKKRNAISKNNIDSLRQALDSMPSLASDVIAEMGDSEWSVQIDQRRYDWKSSNMSNINRLIFLYFIFSIKAMDIFEKELAEKVISLEVGG